MKDAVYLTISLFIFAALAGTVIYGLFRFVRKDSTHLDMDMLWDEKVTREQLDDPKD
ncbi:hypothetical protein [Paenibacillus sp. KN14-4R]|uniref:hypothetical protein n=1 Tax=Paenibacillus sp. KN14-4R TaxID=3445773 RepID=UPI003FA14BE9